MRLSERDNTRLEGVHADIVRVIERAAAMTTVPFVVLEGLRTRQRQRELVARGASRTMNSRHITGHAVDIAPLVDGEVSWDWSDYYVLAPVIKEAARLEGVPLEWGGDWKSFKDGPHWQLPRRMYPASTPGPVTDGEVETPKQDTAIKVAGGAGGATAIGVVTEAVSGAERSAQFFSTDNPVLWVLGTLLLLGIGYIAWQKWEAR